MAGEVDGDGVRAAGDAGEDHRPERGAGAGAVDEERRRPGVRALGALAALGVVDAAGGERDVRHPDAAVSRPL